MCRATHETADKKGRRCEPKDPIAANKAKQNHHTRQLARKKAERKTDQEIRKRKDTLPEGFEVERGKPERRPNSQDKYEPTVKVKDKKTDKTFTAKMKNGARLTFWDLGGKETSQKQTQALEDWLSGLFLFLADELELT